ncbi:M48 family metalloprotease [Actinomadura barringtoniae]|uniref:M48 family metalloprotease n=1 Tax=Actinomadura barringtoniae TaxID=1427535 RepID=A0A939PI34_9ACTN|nr:M48 family metalloprotease [Actinomadura barringtoniae]MBO2452593.1 M48 family metalloprotease [Actinomadura barringtoniae]
MLLTMALLGVAYGALLVPFFMISTLWGLVAAGCVAAALAAQYFFVDGLALRAVGGREVTVDQELDLHVLIDRLCLSAGLPKPRVAVSESDVPNAFAAGCRGAGAVCVTRGLMRRLDVHELETVVGHELGHLAHRDSTVAMIALFPVMLAGLILGFGARLAAGGGFLLVLLAPVLLPLMLISVVVYPFGLLLGLALSRHRELCADRTGSLFTGRPGALSSALAKLTEAIEGAKLGEVRQLRPVTALAMLPMRVGRLDLLALLSTHPVLERRQKQLDMVGQRLASGKG